MKIISHTKMPKKYWSICEARKCPRIAKHIVTIKTKDLDDMSVTIEQNFSFCNKHFEQLKSEVAELKQQ